MSHANEKPDLLCRGRLPLGLSLQLGAVSSDVIEVLQENYNFFIYRVNSKV